MTIEEFHHLSAILTEPYRTMAIVGVCLGLRWSELVGLKWQDIDWLNGELRLQRAVVKQIEDEVKTVHSSKPLALDTRILDLLKQHKQNSVFTDPDDWVFASPGKHGRLPGATHRFGRSWGERVRMPVSSTFRLTAFGIATVRGLMNWAHRSLCSNEPCDTETSA
jgi:integrase